MTFIAQSDLYRLHRVKAGRAEVWDDTDSRLLGTVTKNGKLWVAKAACPGEDMELVAALRTRHGACLALTRLSQEEKK